ncbi:uncharacterized protein LOC129254761 isoform X2 [Lytechinus pictus]|uniref:uncharacterized protein LOC129254761 isoform X2 n=1 Tax=Lytechinus pictus TaxID=7653 RepID=UPI0030BA28C9
MSTDAVKRHNTRFRVKSDSAQPVSPVTTGFPNKKRSFTPPGKSSNTDRALSPHHLEMIVQKAVASAMATERQKISDDLLKMESRLRVALDEKIAALHDLEVAIDIKLHELHDVKSKVEASADKVNELSNRLDHIEQYSRRNNIRILGVKVTPEEDTDAVVVDVAKRIGVQMNAVDIDRSHRLPSRQTSRDELHSSSKSPAIIVKFTSFKSKQQMMKHRRRLKGSGVVVVEDLTKKNADLLTQTSRHPKVTSSWTSDGRVFAIVKNEGGKLDRQLIRRQSDLNKL